MVISTPGKVLGRTEKHQNVWKVMDIFYFHMEIYTVHNL